MYMACHQNTNAREEWKYTWAAYFGCEVTPTLAAWGFLLVGKLGKELQVGIPLWSGH